MSWLCCKEDLEAIREAKPESSLNSQQCNGGRGGKEIYSGICGKTALSVGFCPRIRRNYGRLSLDSTCMCARGLFNSQKLILYATPFTSLLSSVSIFDRAGSVCDHEVRSRRLHTMFKGTASLTFAVTPCSLVWLHLLGPRAGAASWLTLGAPVPRRKLPLGSPEHVCSSHTCLVTKCNPGQPHQAPTS